MLFAREKIPFIHDENFHLNYNLVIKSQVHKELGDAEIRML